MEHWREPIKRAIYESGCCFLRMNVRFAPEVAIRQSVVMEFRPTLLLEKRLN
jgi:hypothetical protein